jgi:hypothetical protein
MAEEDLFLVLAIGDLAELVGEAPARDHGARQLGRLLDVGRAPEVMFSLPNFISSATRPPIMMASREVICL